MRVYRWAYLYLIVYLREKDTTDYNGWEQHVAQMIEAEDVSFFPRNDAIALKEVKQREEAEARAHMDRVTATALRVGEMAAALDGVQARQAEMEKAQQLLLESAMQQGAALHAVQEALGARAAPAPPPTLRAESTASQ